MPPIIAAEEFHIPPDVSPEQRKVFTPATWSLVWHSPVFAKTGQLPPAAMDTTVRVEAFVNEGRWCAMCLWCPGSEYASRIDHRFMCAHCHNVGVLGKWIPVIWPQNWKRIEAILALRPSPQQQWWNPSETLEQLILENEQHNIPTRGRV